MKILASIDIGSNTILLLVARITGSGRIIPLLEDRRTPRLAFGLKQSGRISEKNLEQAVRDINVFKKKALKLGAERIYAVATQAVRSADNRDEVVRHIHEKTGIKVQVISGRKEAELTYLGAVKGMSRLKRRRIVLDIGGASSEFVLAEEKRIVKAISLPVGAVEITEKYKTDRRTSDGTMSEIDEELASFFDARLRDFGDSDLDLIGTGGTISTYKLLDSRPEGFDPSSIHGKSLKLSRLDELLHYLATLKLPERKRVMTFDPERAEVIIAGGLILRSLLKFFAKETVKVSTRNLRWGFLISKL